MSARLVIGICLLGGAVIAPKLAAGASGASGPSSSGAPASLGQLVWSDEFDGPAGTPPDRYKWRSVDGGNGWGDGELEYYTSRPSNASLDGEGHLAITARRETYRGGNGITRSYTSARLETVGLFATTYGRLEASIKLPEGRGLWPAFWAVGTDIESVGWPGSGEIDVMESLGSNPHALYGSIHGPEHGNSNGYNLMSRHLSTVSLASSYHVYGVDWSPGAIVFTFDGIPYSRRTPALLEPGQKWVFNKPFFLILDLAVGGSWPGPPSASTPFPATMLVDWVRAYSGGA